MKRGSGKRKGSGYEREICSLLSRWWTNNERDDIFYRSQSSGGRATSRSKRGKSTAGQYGDVAASDPVGQPLIDFLSIEIKRGYSAKTLHDLLDKSNKSKLQQYEEWFDQAINSHKNARSYSWMLIVRRDKRDALIICPTVTLYQMAPIEQVLKLARLELFYLRDEASNLIGVTIIRLEDWLVHALPDCIRKYAGALKPKAV